MFFSKKNTLIGLDIGSRSIKIAEMDVKKSGDYVLKKFGMTPIAPGVVEDGAIRKPELVAEAIRQLIGDYKIKETNVATSIGGYSVIVKNISVQKMDEEQLQETIQFEAEQYIPYDINDVNLDFQIQGENEDNPNQMDVTLVAAKKDMINDYVSLMQSAGLTLCIIDVSAFALQNIYEVNYELGDDCVALIDIGANNTTLNILKNANSRFMRDVSLGCQQVIARIASDAGVPEDEAEKMFLGQGADGQLSSKDALEIVTSMASDWCAEIRRALDFFYSQNPGEQISRIVLSGGGSNIDKFRELLAAETSCDVEMINPFEEVRLDNSLDTAYLETVAPQAAICMGLAIRRLDDK
ncbi:MAG: pilus assembly protein PilM [Desulfobacterales bacterium]|nr:MAG: pilus assembly protein PilM [Desulfobacterales bacterium]